MKKIDLIEEISKQSKMSRSESKLCVEVILSELTSAIASGEGVEMRGFGGFYKRHRKGRIGINPKTGAKLTDRKISSEETAIPYDECVYVRGLKK